MRKAREYVGLNDYVIQDTFTMKMIRRNRLYPTREFAELFREKSEFLLRCIYFKWYYDRDYVPDWKSDYCNKWYVYKEYSKEHGANVPEYIVGVSDTGDENHIYFSSRKIAEKCAEWLNYVYGEKKEE